jgi:tRNA-specific 2-thiouridylase
VSWELHNQLPAKGAKVVVAMSGGVDSSVAAGWLSKNGYQVIGISLQLHDMAEKIDNEFGTCCSLSDLNDARRVAEVLDIPFYVNNMETAFNEAVIDDFVQEYLNGRTPNPCVRCNEKVKFKKLMDWALDLGADFLATGHYATIQWNKNLNRHELHKGGDDGKDQSYFLFTMAQDDLAKTLFPVGAFEKSVVRSLAQEYGLRVANKPDSQEICFVQGKSYKDFIEEKVPAEVLRPGNFVNSDGKVLGQHAGLHHYTVGQRKGIHLNSLEPLYVLALNASKNEIIVGPESALFRKSAVVKNVSWINSLDLAKPINALAKIRYRSKESPVQITSLGDHAVEVKFEVPQRAITPGQAMVFYEGTRTLGGGWIDSLSVHS